MKLPGAPVLLALLSIATLTTYAADEPGFKPLFNGTDLTGWKGDMKYFSVRDGCIHAETSAAVPLTKNTFLVCTVGEFADFELRFDYKVTGGNSGIQYRSELVSDFVMR